LIYNQSRGKELLPQKKKERQGAKKHTFSFLVFLILEEKMCKGARTKILIKLGMSTYT
jgi:hypothetical protein